MLLYKKIMLFNVLVLISFNVCAAPQSLLERLKHAYPDHIQEVNEQYVLWKDGTCMPIYDENAQKSTSEKLNNPSLADHMEQIYVAGKLDGVPQGDPGRIRYEPFFRKMYGMYLEEVEGHLEEIDWMPKIFGAGTYKLKATRVNNLHEKLRRISEELEKLVLCKPHYIIFLVRPGGTFNWRCIANTTRISAHSFGMTIDINFYQTHYWQWDLAREGAAISEESPLVYRNTVPHEIISIFEKYGFIWGGKWHHYDTQHFEYRPELFLFEKNN